MSATNTTSNNLSQSSLNNNIAFNHIIGVTSHKNMEFHQHVKDQNRNERR